PIVTSGPVLALSLAADLFLEEGRTVLLPALHPPGYPEIFTLRTGALARTYVSPAGLAAALAAVEPAEPALVVLRAPEGPALAAEERQAWADALAAAAGERPIVALLDDLWEREGSSLFWDLSGLHPGLIPVKVDGPGGELGFPGAGVGFLTFPFDPDSEIARAIEGKVKMLSRAVVGSPPAAGQAILLEAIDF